MWLVTGAAGFIGAHLCRDLLRDGLDVVGVDSLDDYYDPQLKRARLRHLVSPAARRPDAFTFHQLDLADRDATRELFERVRPEVVVHLAAQAGVRLSISRPEAYVQANLVGFANVLEGCRRAREAGVLAHLLYASSSSVYGGDDRLPFDTHDPYAGNHPVSLYAATKRSNELMAHAYSHLYGLPTTSLRFFTVYGGWGRPDMAYWRFAEAIVEGRPIELYGDGSAVRDFTYVDDVTAPLARLARQPTLPDETYDPALPDPAGSGAPWRVVNVGYGGQASMTELIRLLELHLQRPARVHHSATSPGDVPSTRAEAADLRRLVPGVTPTPLEQGLRHFVDWYRAWRETGDRSQLQPGARRD